MKPLSSFLRALTGTFLSLGSISASPAGMERPLSTDRPDTTESPFTVEKGRFQIEMEIAAVTVDGGMRSYSFAETNFKWGIGHSTDLQFVVPFHEQDSADNEGIGDIQIRLKRNLWGNDEGGTAMAFMPYLQLPTGADGIGGDRFQGGLIFPYAIEGEDGWSYGMQAQLDLVSASPEGGHDFQFLASATVARDLGDRIGAFLELVTVFTQGSPATSEQYVNSGLTCALSETCQLDGGVRVGLSNDARDFTPFFGISTKF